MNKHIIITLFLSLLSLHLSFAQVVEDVTLVTTASAPTEEEAIVLALRSAIEQTYGAFVSANTSILNDEIVRDEVVSVSHGNVKSYEILSSLILKNGHVEVTLNSTISISKLISFAKSKGADAEFAGQTFSMNMKLMNLKGKNALAAYENMCIQAEELLDGAFDYKIDIEDPVIAEATTEDHKRESGYLFNVKVKVLATPRTSQIFELISNTLKSIRLSNSEVEDFKRVGKDVYNYILRRPGASDVVFFLPISGEDLNKLQSLDKSLNQKAINSFLNYSLVEKSDNESYVSWQYGQVFGRKMVEYNGRGISTGGKSDYWLVSSNGTVSGVFKYESGYVLYLKENRGSSLHLDEGYVGDPVIGIFADRIDRQSSWKNWRLPIIKRQVPVNDDIAPAATGKNPKKNSKKQQMRTIEEYSTIEQIIAEYSLPYFIPTDKMDSFTGLSVQTPSYTLAQKSSTPKEISSTIKDFFSFDTEEASMVVTSDKSLKISCANNSLFFNGRYPHTYYLKDIEQNWVKVNPEMSICLFNTDNSQVRVLFSKENKMGSYTQRNKEYRYVYIIDNQANIDDLRKFDKYEVKSVQPIDKAQDLPSTKVAAIPEAIPFQQVEQKPSFYGGDAKEFSKWVNKHLIYPEAAEKERMQGIVTLRFTINSDGSISNVKVIRGVDSSLDKEAVRVVSSSPKWEPGRQNNEPVPVMYTFPVIFQLR